MTQALLSPDNEADEMASLTSYFSATHDDADEYEDDEYDEYEEYDEDGYLLPAQSLLMSWVAPALELLDPYHDVHVLPMLCILKRIHVFSIAMLKTDFRTGQIYELAKFLYGHPSLGQIPSNYIRWKQFKTFNNALHASKSMLYGAIETLIYIAGRRCDESAQSMQHALFGTHAGVGLFAQLNDAVAHFELHHGPTASPAAAMFAQRVHELLNLEIGKVLVENRL